MSLDIIKQEAKSIKEAFYTYEDLIRKKLSIKSKSELKNVEDKIKEIKDYMVSLSQDIDSVLEEEILKIKNV